MQSQQIDLRFNTLSMKILLAFCTELHKFILKSSLAKNITRWEFILLNVKTYFILDNGFLTEAEKLIYRMGKNIGKQVKLIWDVDI